MEHGRIRNLKRKREKNKIKKIRERKARKRYEGGGQEDRKWDTVKI